MDDHLKVKETLRHFNKLYLHCIQEEETRRSDTEEKLSKAANGSKPKGKKEAMKVKGSRRPKKQKVSKSVDLQCEVDIKRTSKRPDLKALTKMKLEKSVLYQEKRIGHIPGVEVGHQFYSRCEMVAVGFHSHWLNGIDYMGSAYSKKTEYQGYTFPLAVAIVLSGQYEDDLDDCNDIVYTGQGGHDLLGTKRQVVDQKMKQGNLALKNSKEHQAPVRVIRGHKSVSSYVGKIYTYDGLYEVIDYWAEKGNAGFTVFRYRLHRIEGQPALTTSQVHFARLQAPTCSSDLRGLVCADISGGQENFAIPATNVIDEPPLAPTGFTYCKAIQRAGNIKLPSKAPGCKCKGLCIDPKICACARRNGTDFPYVHKDGGRLVEAKPVVFECGSNCTCGPECINRTSQQGLKYRLEVFRTPSKGWAVRSWDSIPSGAPVCEYTGILKRASDIDNASENNFIFDIDCLQTMHGLDGREKRRGDVAALFHVNEDDLEVPEYCIDAGSAGSVARFINHSCDPNLFVQCVLSSHHDIRLARIMLFAADTIPPLQELTYDYGYILDSVTGPDGLIQKMPCYCGTVNCRKWLY